ncbi:hypothetical protein VTJ83DRAFT_2521 [Remersonia thermophila]|uniref:Uncharacterized protein n=1 Tax=Remersonia thermophila TaxID=72144 RepID=A0ABR4DJ67_9PEZI
MVIVKKGKSASAARRLGFNCVHRVLLWRLLISCVACLHPVTLADTAQKPRFSARLPTACERTQRFSISLSSSLPSRHRGLFFLIATQNQPSADAVHSRPGSNKVAMPTEAKAASRQAAAGSKRSQSFSTTDESDTDSSDDTSRKTKKRSGPVGAFRLIPCRDCVGELVRSKDWEAACHHQSQQGYRCAECATRNHVCRPLHPSTLGAIVEFLRFLDAKKHPLESEANLVSDERLTALGQDVLHACRRAPAAPRTRTDEFSEYWSQMREAEAELRRTLRSFGGPRVPLGSRRSSAGSADGQEELIAAAGALHEEVAEMREEVTEMHKEVVEVREEVAEMREEVAEMRKEMAEVREEVAEMREEVAEMRKEMAEMRKEVAEMRDSLGEEVAQLRDFLCRLAAHIAPQMMEGEDVGTAGLSRTADTAYPDSGRMGLPGWGPYRPRSPGAMSTRTETMLEAPSEPQAFGVQTAHRRDVGAYRNLLRGALGTAGLYRTDRAAPARHRRLQRAYRRHRAE